MPDNENFVPIRKAVELTGLSQRQIRYYEQKGLVCPERTPGGQRLFSPRDVARLEQIRNLHAAGYPLAVIEGILEGNYPGRPLGRRNLASLIPSGGTDVQSVFPVRDQAKLYDLLTRRNPTNQERND